MEAMSIGKLAGRSGLPVKTIRFYSDEGLLPPSGRTEAGYRLYGEVDVARLELIRTLREAGLDLTTIRSVLDRQLSLGGALALRLQAVEAHIASLRRIAAALRAVGPDPDDDDLRRLNAVTTISNEQRRAVIARFFEEVGPDTPEYRAWAEQMIAASVPDLPDEPTKDQLDAWIELSEILSDPGFIENMRSMSEASWSEPRPDFDQAAYHAAFWQLMNEVDAARGVDPASPEADALVKRFVELSGDLHGETDSPEFRRTLLGLYEGHDPRASRYWEARGDHHEGRRGNGGDDGHEQPGHRLADRRTQGSPRLIATPLSSGLRSSFDHYVAESGGKERPPVSRGPVASL